MAANSSITREPALSKFIDALLVPVARESIVDTAYNSQLRHERQIKWRIANRRYDFWKALDEVSMALDLGGFEIPSSLHLPNRATCLNELRSAYAALLHTPAYDRTTAAWKKRQRAGSYYGFDAETLKRLVEEDEAFLDAHPVTRRPRKPRAKRT